MDETLDLPAPAVLKLPIDLDELVELVDLPDGLIKWSLELPTGEVYPGPHDNVELIPLPSLSQEQILLWMAAFALRLCPRMRSLLAAALRYPAPEKRFPEVLIVNPDAQREWEVYFDLQRRTVVLEWLHALGLEPGSAGADV